MLTALARLPLRYQLAFVVAVSDCSCDGDCDSDAEEVREGISCLPPGNSSEKCYGLEDLFFEAGVDLFIVSASGTRTALDRPLRL